MRLGYRFQLLYAFSILLLGGGIGGAILLSRRLASELEEVMIRQAGALARNLALWGEEAALTEDRVELLRLVADTKASNDEVVYIFVHDARERLLAHSFEGSFPVGLAVATAGRPRTLLSTEQGSVLDIRAPILREQGGEVHVGYSRRRILTSVRWLGTLIWLITIPIMLVGVVAITVVSGYLSRPAQKLTKVVRRFGAGELSVRVEERLSGEIGTVAEAFNTMADNLEKQANELRYLTEYNQNLIDNLGVGLYVVNQDMRVEYANEEVLRDVGDVRGQRFHDVFCHSSAPCPECAVVQAAAAQGVKSRTCGLPDGTCMEQTAIPIRSADGSVSTIVTRRNITEAVQLRERMTQHEKLAAVGELSAVVAHEVNNPLDGMQSLVRLVIDSPGVPEGPRRHLMMVEEGLGRMEMIVRRLLTFTSDSAEPSETTTLEEQVDRALIFVGKRLKALGVEVVTHFEQDGAMVRIDPNRFPQVLVNLALNAADAMPDGGTLEIRSKVVSGGIQLSFEDHGPGVPPHLHERIFQPFFTTKSAGKGTGLGLAVSRRIVAGHGGMLTVLDTPGGGATFRLWLPAPSEAYSSTREVEA